MFERDSFGNCPIHYCIGATSNADFISIVSTLRRRYISTKSFMVHMRECGALNCPCMSYSIDEQDENEQQTLLHLAAIQGKTEYVRILRHKFNAGVY